MNYYEHRLYEIRQEIGLLYGRPGTETRITELENERQKILDDIKVLD